MDATTGAEADVPKIRPNLPLTAKKKLALVAFDKIFNNTLTNKVESPLIQPCLDQLLDRG